MGTNAPREEIKDGVGFPSKKTLLTGWNLGRLGGWGCWMGQQGEKNFGKQWNLTSVSI